MMELKYVLILVVVCLLGFIVLPMTIISCKEQRSDVAPLTLSPSVRSVKLKSASVVTVVSTSKGIIVYYMAEDVRP